MGKETPRIQSNAKKEYQKKMETETPRIQINAKNVNNKRAAIWYKK
jgi:hypothetical protein